MSPLRAPDNEGPSICWMDTLERISREHTHVLGLRQNRPDPPKTPTYSTSLILSAAYSCVVFPLSLIFVSISTAPLIVITQRTPNCFKVVEKFKLHQPRTAGAKLACLCK